MTSLLNLFVTDVILEKNLVADNLMPKSGIVEVNFHGTRSNESILIHF